MPCLTKLWWLLCAHALCDYVLQSEPMAEWKSPMAHPPPQMGPWWWWMTAHALINGLGVTYITQNPLLGIGETVVHFILDTFKCQQHLSATQDQVGHLLSKVAWALL